MVTKEKQDNNDVIIVGVCNEEVHTANRINKFLQQNRLYSTIENKHKENIPSTYGRGSKCTET